MNRVNYEYRLVGAIKTTDTSVTIGTNTQGAELSSASAFLGGTARNRIHFHVHVSPHPAQASG